MKKKTQLEINLMRRESEARITMIAVIVIAFNSTINKIRFMNVKDDLINEILSEV
jgi:hypothetical protein